VRLLVASPPCQAWSKAGKRGGIADQPRIWDHLADVRETGRWVDYPRDGWHDDRSPLVLELVRWVGTLRPGMVVAEQVPDVLPFWAEVCRWLRGIGYSATCGLLSAERYGVPQTRQRAFLVARRNGRPARLPAPTHARYVAPRGGDVQGDGLFAAPAQERIVLPADRHLLPWVSMADALGWAGSAGGRPARTMCGDRGPRWAYGEGENSYATGWTLRTGNNSAAAGGSTTPYEVDPVGRPSPTLTGNVNRWTGERPATTVQGDPRLAGPGHRDREGGQRQFDGDAVRLTVEQAGVLQSFPADYPWQGTRTARFRQVGDAVPPLLAAAVLGELLDVRAQVAPRRSR
jgi:DNA (cytosine-5)-methyltransferase 1